MLGSKFAFLLACSGPPTIHSEVPAALKSALPEATLTFTETSDPLAETKKPDGGEPFLGVLRVRGSDQPGIMRSVSEIMEENNFSIERIETTIDDEDHPEGQQLFLMEGLVCHRGDEPEDWSPFSAIDACDNFSQEYNIDCTLEVSGSESQRTSLRT